MAVELTKDAVNAHQAILSATKQVLPGVLWRYCVAKSPYQTPSLCHFVRPSAAEYVRRRLQGLRSTPTSRSSNRFSPNWTRIIGHREIASSGHWMLSRARSGLNCHGMSAACCKCLASDDWPWPGHRYEGRAQHNSAGRNSPPNSSSNVNSNADIHAHTNTHP